MATGSESTIQIADPPKAGAVVIAGGYQLMEPRRDGGFLGSVWMAEQKESVERAVAVKLVKAGMDSRAVPARSEAED